MAQTRLFFCHKLNCGCRESLFTLLTTRAKRVSVVVFDGLKQKLPIVNSLSLSMIL